VSQSVLALFGLAAGYVIASLLESVIHEYVSDAGDPRVARWLKHPLLARPLLRARFSHHVIHHFQTYRADYVSQFVSIAHRERLRTMLLRRGRHGRIIIAGDFGNRLHGEGAFFFTLPSLAAGTILLLTTPLAFAGAAAPGLLLPPFFSHFVHPYLHTPPATLNAQAPRLVAMLLRTHYGRWMYRNHFMHHRTGGTSNFNLVLGADWLRRRIRRPSAADREAMVELGIL
jgi:hypothetical protein